MNLKITSAMLGAVVLAACAAHAQGVAPDAAAGAPQIDAAPATPPPAGPPPQPPQGGPPAMPKPVTLVDRPNATGGEALYVEYCAMCHAPNGMGHGLLGRRIDTPDLEARGNLVAQYVVTAARIGIGNMPAIPRGEVSDADLQAIADYLAAGPHEVTP